MVQQHWITEASPAEKPDTGDSQPTVAGDQPKLAFLSEELEPCDELRKLVKNLGAGQPVREMEPSEGALREAKLAAKMGRFLHFHSPKVEEIIKAKRPLPHSVCSELPASKQQSCSNAVPWVMS